jgi:hypothetical protein
MADPITGLDILHYTLPFFSGIFGGGVVWGMTKVKLIELDRRMGRVEDRLDEQVGESRCTKMREECKHDITAGMADIKNEILNNRVWVTDRFQEIARFMGAHNGH